MLFIFLTFSLPNHFLRFAFESIFFPIKLASPKRSKMLMVPLVPWAGYRAVKDRNVFPWPQGVVWRENTVSNCQPEKFPKREPGIRDILTQPFHIFNHLRTQRKIHVKQVSMNSDGRQTYGMSLVWKEPAFTSGELCICLLPAQAPHSPAFGRLAALSKDQPYWNPSSPLVHCQS